MSAISHTWGYFSGLPINGAKITPTGASALTAARVIGEITEENEHRINNEDINEDGQLVGERHDDLIKHINLTLKLTSGITIPGLNTTVAIAGATAYTNRYNGNWKIASVGLAFKADDGVELPLKLKKCEYLTYAVA